MTTTQCVNDARVDVLCRTRQSGEHGYTDDGPIYYRLPTDDIGQTTIDWRDDSLRKEE